MRFVSILLYLTAGAWLSQAVSADPPSFAYYLTSLTFFVLGFVVGLDSDADRR